MFFKRIKPFLPYALAYRRQNAIGILALLLTDMIGLAIPWLLKQVIDLLPSKPSSGQLISYAGALFFAAAMQGVFRFGWRKYLFGPSRYIEFDILNQLYNHFLALDKSFYQRQKVGDLMSRATNDLRSIREFFGLGLLVFVDAFVVIVSCLSLMTYINPILTSYALLPLPVVSLLFYGFSKAISIQHRVVQEHLSKISSMVQENLAGIRVLHAFVQEENEKRKFDVLNREYLQKNMRLTKLFGIFNPSLSFVVGIAALISLWIGGKAVISEEMTLGAFVAFNGYLMMLSWPMMAIGFVFNLSQKGLSAMKRLHEILSVNPLVFDRAGAVEPEQVIEGEIEFRRVSFAYPGTGAPTLREISLQISKGHSIAVLGMVGAGKSTLVQLVPRLFDPQEGEVLVDGRPVREISLSVLRRSIGYVDQEPYLFSTSIKENIALGCESATDAQIDRIVHIAGLEPDLAVFPQGLATLVGERGVSLSGGQKQRIALARALLRKPVILILDDAFSSLDVETEEKILKNIKEVIRGMTTILVTHRLSAVRQVDRIVVMEQGRIVEQGGHAELLGGNGYYRKVYRNQMLAREMEIIMQ